MSENFLWATYGVADAGDRLGPRGHPVLQRARRRRRSTPTRSAILKDTKHPDEAFDAS